MLSWASRLRWCRWPVTRWSAFAYFIWRVETQLTTELTTFVYFLMVTGSTTGYGDLLPTTEFGRLVVALWVIPLGMLNFAAMLGLISARVAGYWGKIKMGQTSYENKTGHTIIFGWRPWGYRLLRQLEEEGVSLGSVVVVDSARKDRPVPDVLFVRSGSVMSEDALRRSGVRGASKIIISANTDEATFVLAVAAARRSKSDTHIVCYMESETKSELLHETEPRIEVLFFAIPELLAKASWNPGAGVISRSLNCSGEGQHQYSMTYDGVPESFGNLSTQFRNTRRAMLIGMLSRYSQSEDDIELNPDHSRLISSGDKLFYLSEKRIELGGE